MVCISSSLNIYTAVSYLIIKNKGELIHMGLIKFACNRMEQVAETGSVVGGKRKSSRNISGISKKGKAKKNMEKLSDSIDDEHIVDFISKDKKKTLLKSVTRRKRPTEPSVSSIPAAPTVIYFIIKLVFYFKIKPKKRFGGVAQDFNDTSVLLEMKLRFSREQEKIFRKTPFGFLFDMHTLVFQKELVHLMLLRQLNTERDDQECWYKIGSKAVRFGVEEFSAITGFNCGGQYDLKPLSKKKMLKFKSMMFPNFGITDKVTRRDVRDVFLDQEFLIDDDDVVKMGVVCSNGFAFGKMLWERTFYYLTIAIKDGNSIFDELEAKGKNFKKYKLPGFVVPFHVWLYEIIPSLSPEYCVRKGSEFRRILNWQSFDVPGFVTLLEKVFNNPEKLVIVDDFRLTDAERRNRLLKNFKFQPVYLPKSVDDEKDFEEKFENICRNLSFIKDSQASIHIEMAIFKDEFSGDLAKLSGMIEKMTSKNHEKMDTTDLFGASDREAYYRDLSDDVGGLELSVPSVKSAVHEDNVDYGQYYLSPDVMKVVDNTIKDVLCSKDQPSCEKNNNMEMVVFDDSYQTPENPKRIRKESSIVLSPFITDFGSSDSGKDSLMNILIGDKLIVDGLNPFKNEIGDNNTSEQCLKFIQWLEHNINMKRTKKKYSDIDNKIDPPMDFSFIQIDEKIEYNKFLENHSNPSTINFDSVISRYILGEYLFSNTAWVFTDHVLIIVHVKDQSHWILIHFSIKDRMLNVYNSLSGLRNQNKALPHVKAYSVMLPYFLEFLNFYASRPDLSMEVGPYSVGIREPINYTFIKGLPTQKKRIWCVLRVLGGTYYSNFKLSSVVEDDNETCYDKNELLFAGELIDRCGENIN
ncbi:hypothetical protein G4B88_021832 [Cannabis sativa]|uniref:Ubiquitin-like protease family profile domain-containing protein n=1 Tax=Cannabis sativa TaxID=3483 RepID=A0A7J6EI36_CANSA|nr:hypothetical protein G4B88_021832 [Cannabis sativa]